MFRDQTWILIGLTSLLVLAVLALLLSGRYRRSFMVNLSGVLVVAGGLGNLIDRIWHGYVIDFFYFELINFPIFNVADIYVTVTFIVLVLLIFFYYKDEDFSIYSRRQEQKHAD